MAEETSASGIWCIVANVVQARLAGQERVIQLGTKHFTAGTKVYCCPLSFTALGDEKVMVVSRHRGSPRLVTMILDAMYLTNWRVKRIYQPFVIEIMRGFWDNKEASKRKAEEIVRIMILRHGGQEPYLENMPEPGRGTG